MNIFVAGVHGVGKTYLARQVPPELGFTHASASQLISEERSLPSWSANKHVNDIEKNQVALIAAVKRHNDAGICLLLDGHFVLINSEGEATRLGEEVFSPLNLSLVILLESSAERIASQIFQRDNRVVELDNILGLIITENDQARVVCEAIGLPLVILKDPNIDSFIDAIYSLDFQG